MNTNLFPRMWTKMFDRSKSIEFSIASFLHSQAKKRCMVLNSGCSGRIWQPPDTVSIYVFLACFQCSRAGESILSSFHFNRFDEDILLRYPFHVECWYPTHPAPFLCFIRFCVLRSDRPAFLQCFPQCFSSNRYLLLSRMVQ